MTLVDAMTPAGFLQGLLAQVSEQSATAEPVAIAGLLDQVSPTLEDLGRRDLASRLGVTGGALRSGDYGRTDWLNSRLYRELGTIQQALEEGQSVEDALRAQAEALQQLVGTPQPGLSPVPKPARVHIGPPPVIRWHEFGSKEYRAPNPPSADVTAAGKRLSYLFYYVAGVSGHGETEGAVEEFFGISERVRRRIRDGQFVPEDIGQFPSADATKLIRKAAKVEPKYGQLMTELAVQAFFESQAWSLGVPTKQAPWSIGLLYGLRRFVGHRFLTEEGKAAVLADKPLVRVVRGLVSLNKVNWHVHEGKTRRDVLDPWILAMSPFNRERVERHRLVIGDGILNENGWSAPKPGASQDQRLQWLVRYWIAHAHFGAIPAHGLPVPPDAVIRFALARKPANLAPAFREALTAIMRGFYTDEELASLDIGKRTRRTA